MKLILEHKVLAGISAVAVLVLVFFGVWAGRAVAQGNEAVGETGDVAPEVQAQAEFICKIETLTADYDRVQVKCKNAPEEFKEVQFFASANDSTTIRNTNQFLVLLNTAYAMNRQVGVRFDASAAANPAGCGAADCRKITGIYTRP